jgi:hypothetical protein
LKKTMYYCNCYGVLTNLRIIFRERMKETPDIVLDSSQHLADLVQIVGIEKKAQKIINRNRLPLKNVLKKIRSYTTQKRKRRQPGNDRLATIKSMNSEKAKLNNRTHG